MSDPLLAARNVAARAWRRAAAVPKRMVRLTRRTRRLRQQAAIFQGEWQVERELAALARGRGPIIAGPWLSEVGFEVLYWIPFLAWFEDRYRVDRERVVARSEERRVGKECRSWWSACPSTRDHLRELCVIADISW